MKTLLYLVLMTLICHLLHVSAGPVALQLLKGDCCPRVSQHGIPKKCVKNMSMTPDHCKLKAVVVTDTTNRRFCINASLTWTKQRWSEYQKSAGQKDVMVQSVDGCRKPRH
ncbi:hypothetical protein F2P81_025423 [Scophthalmus maximus]|uniref:Chemokine interleukin-8-like domain-containing protein n=1 Tax=Scophthalmus maximus TaxID=52904 RepID=A0A6A4RQ15_SCOMX|nr:hypothetical protein F2P81_025423 [Scophthalmus maximus]